MKSSGCPVCDKIVKKYEEDGAWDEKYISHGNCVFCGSKLQERLLRVLKNE